VVSSYAALVASGLMLAWSFVNVGIARALLGEAKVNPGATPRNNNRGGGMTDDDSTPFDWAVPPGEILFEALEEREMNPTELARQMGRTVEEVYDLFVPTIPITAEIAADLEQALGISAGMWLGLEREYRKRLAQMRRSDEPNGG
jgi:plasmid maintenance system antidote protein VapI